MAIDDTYGFMFVGCATVEGTPRRLALYAATTFIAWVTQAKVHLLTVCRRLLTLYTE